MNVRCYRVWTPEEEEALRAGVHKHGIGSWEIIRQDATFSHLLCDRTGVQLKDKWRNLVKFKHVSRTEAENAASRSPGYRIRKYAGTALRPSSSSAEPAAPAAPVERSRQDTAARNKQTLVPLLSNAESVPASSRRRRSSAGSEQSQQDIHEQLHRAKEILASALADSMAAETALSKARSAVHAAAEAGKLHEQSPMGMDRSTEREAARWSLDCTHKVKEAEANVRSIEEAMREAEPSEDTDADPRERRKRGSSPLHQPQRSSRRTAAKGRKRYSDYDYDEDPADDGGAASGDDDGSTPRRFRNLRFTTEDRRFGIYDERRYQANGHASPQSHTPSKSGGGGFTAVEPEERDSGMVECPCGISYDDGQAMIECERCKVCIAAYSSYILTLKVWAHISCLNDQMAQHPKRYRYNMEHFMCNLCQQELRDHAAHAASRSEQASPRNGLASQGRKSGMQSAFAAEAYGAARMHRIVPSSGGQPLSGGRVQRRSTPDPWMPASARALSADDRSPGSRAEGRSKASRLRHRSSVNSEHPARLLDREDSRHYSGFLSSTEELSMDVPDLLASLLELGAQQAPHKGGQAPSGGHAARPGTLAQWDSEQQLSSRARRDRHPAARAAAAQQWDRGDWAEPGPITPGSRRPSDSSLPLHEAWMQHEAEWAQLNRGEGSGRAAEALRWEGGGSRSARARRPDRMQWPHSHHPLTQPRPPPQLAGGRITPPSLWEPAGPAKRDSARQQALHIVTGQQPSALSGSPGNGKRGSGHLQHPMAQGLAALESLKASQRLAPARTPGHHDMNGAGLGRPRQQAIHIRSTSPGHRIIQKTPGRPGSAPDGRHASMSGLNEPLALPQSSHALTEMPPMEALYAAFAGAAGEPQHDLTLDPAAMDIHDGDEMAPGQLERVVSGGSEGSGGQLARTNSHYIGPVGSEALTQHWVQHAWGDAGHVMNRPSLPPKKAAAAAASAAAEAQAAADAAAAAVAFGADDLGSHDLDDRENSQSSGKDEGLGDLAAHLVAFHNMGASPAHDDPFTSDVKVDFDGDKEEGSDAENSPHAQSQQRNVAGTTFIEDSTFESTAQGPSSLGIDEAGDKGMFAEIDNMINVTGDHASDVEAVPVDNAEHAGAEATANPDM